jgi:hypothetical protein
MSAGTGLLYHGGEKVSVFTIRDKKEGDEITAYIRRNGLDKAYAKFHVEAVVSAKDFHQRHEQLVAKFFSLCKTGPVLGK